MRELNIYVPTYNASAFPDDVESGAKQELGEPFVPVVIRRADGVRVVLGSHDYWDSNAPDVQIERRPGGWVIFLHPYGGGDSSGFVYFLDDGRSFVVPESDLGTTPPVKMVTSEEAIREIDHLSDESEKAPPDEEISKEACELCGDHLAVSGDNWDGLCPRCADHVSEYLDDKGLEDGDRDTVIKILRHDK